MPKFSDSARSSARRLKNAEFSVPFHDSSNFEILCGIAFDVKNHRWNACLAISTWEPLSVSGVTGNLVGRFQCSNTKGRLLSACAQPVSLSQCHSSPSSFERNNIDMIQEQTVKLLRHRFSSAGGDHYLAFCESQIARFEGEMERVTIIVSQISHSRSK
jgi:hypothetical protein